jgi:hypothetical protein
MKHLIILLLALISLGLVAQEKESKTQPKEVTLSKDSQSDKYGEVPFNHENHSIKKYSPDGQSVLSCVECHHTDQPPASLKPPLKTSERTVLLTTESLAAADAKPVKSCRACHLQAGDDSAPMPTVQNCNLCHDKAIAARPALKGKVPGSNDCIPCHKPAG